MPDRTRIFTEGEPEDQTFNNPQMLIPYIGGKTRLAKAIIALLPPHRTYVEVFGGGAQVLLRKKPSEVEILNDIDDDLVTLYRVVQYHWEEFIRCLRFQLSSRTWFSLLQRTDPKTLTDIQRATRFYYLQKGSFGGLVRKRAYHYFIAKQPNFNPNRVAEVIEAVHARLAHVQIECLPFEQLLPKFDSDQTCYFLDPPYLNRTLYNHNFTLSDFETLAAILIKIKGKFILTVSDDREMHMLFEPFSLFSTSLVYTAKKDARKRFQELLVANFTPTQLPPSVYPLGK